MRLLGVADWELGVAAPWAGCRCADRRHFGRDLGICAATRDAAATLYSTRWAARSGSGPAQAVALAAAGSLSTMVARVFIGIDFDRLGVFCEGRGSPRRSGR